MLRVLKQIILTTLFAVFASQASAMFIQPDWFDPTQPGVGTNRYSYSFNDPINLMDPGGNQTFDTWDKSEEDAAAYNLRTAERAEQQAAAYEAEAAALGVDHPYYSQIMREAGRMRGSAQYYRDRANQSVIEQGARDIISGVDVLGAVPGIPTTRAPKPKPKSLSAAAVPQVSQRLVGKSMSNPRHWNGCENCAKQIQAEIGGTIHRITPAGGAPGLGPYRGV